MLLAFRDNARCNRDWCERRHRAVVADSGEEWRHGYWLAETGARRLVHPLLAEPAAVIIGHSLFANVTA